MIEKGDKVNIDFSDFKDGKQVLMFAKQTKKGRAIPLYYEVLKYPIEKVGSQNIFIVQAIKNFQKIIGNIKVKYVFDRGFAAPYIIEQLAKNKIIFYIRIKKGKHVIYGQNNKKDAVKNIHLKDKKVKAYNLKLRIIRSDKPDNGNDPWYIVTNDFKSLRNSIIKSYYYRFEIEELFKDAKRFFGLEYLKTKKEISFQIVLWFVIIGIWLGWYLHKTLAKGKRLIKSYSQKYSVSIVKYWLEKLILESRLLALQKITYNTG